MDPPMQHVTLSVIYELNQMSYNALAFAGDDFEDIFRKIVSQRIRSVICTRKEVFAQDSCVLYARKHHLRMVMCMAEQRFEDFPVFCSDCKGNTKKLFYHLYELGHRNMLFLHDGTKESVWINLQWQSLQEEAQTLPGIGLASMRFHDREKLLPNILKLKTTAIICAYPAIAEWVEEFLQNKGLRIPEDLSIVCYGDNKQFLEFMPPVSITSVCEKTTPGWMQLIADYLFHKDPTLPASAYTRFHEGELIVRQSSATPSSEIK
jgi:DNA-binding LacI/PurR family transcriptional regulator